MVNWWIPKIFSALVILALVGCEKDEVEEPIDLGYDYFPLDEGRFIVYEVDSTGFGLNPITSSYEIKEYITNPFLDGENQQAYEVHRFRRESTQSPWILQNIWIQKRTTISAERTENNERFVKMVFPAKGNQTWDGNAYNTRPAATYTLGALDSEALVGPFFWNNTVKVTQENAVNLIEEKRGEEIYARDVGLIYKLYIDKETQMGLTTGVEIEMVVADAGFE